MLIKGPDIWRDRIDQLLGLNPLVVPSLVTARDWPVSGPVAWILSHTPIVQEPRLIRQAWSLQKAGWRVVVAGQLAGQTAPATWTVVSLGETARVRPLPYRVLLRLQREAGRFLYRRTPPGSWPARAGARLSYYGESNWREAARDLMAAAQAHPDFKPSLVIAHDYATCPPALALARRAGAPLIVDCHEYARGQYAHDPRWQSDGRLFATALQDDMLAQADAVTTVSEGIAERLNAEQRLARPVVTLRSMPFYEAMPFRATGETVTVLYHGLLAVDRGLHELLNSVRYWQPHLRLVIRGHGDDSEVANLKTLANEQGIAGRVTFEPSVPFHDIVSAANQADIGYFVQPDGSPQKRFTLPNKFFEYTMAGLALAVSDLPEMARLVDRYGLGAIISKPDPALIASALNRLQRTDIDRCKQASLLAAYDLSWDREHATFMSLVEELMR
jgi:glycogen synthase